MKIAGKKIIDLFLYLFLHLFVCLLLVKNPDSVLGASLSTSAGTYVLTEDSTLNGQVQIQNGQTYDLDLHGHSLTMTNAGVYFMVNSGGTLNIRDSVGGGVIYNATYAVWLYNGGTLNMHGGTIDGSKMSQTPQMGGAIYMASPMNENCVFNMYGGVIQNCKATQSGGGVYINGQMSNHTCTFNMYGGSILNCEAPDGGGIYVDQSGNENGILNLYGENKITIKKNRATNKGSAIFNNGTINIKGTLDIDDVVYLARNNWADNNPGFINVVGHLLVVGDGYIDLDTNYPANSNVPGHTVVRNATVGTEAEITPEEFYTYGFFFENTTRNLMVSAGFDPTKNDLDSSGTYPNNWPTNQADQYSQTYTYTYIDVKGQTMVIQASDSGAKREMQNYNYLIYTDRHDTSQDYIECFSIKVQKKDTDTGNLLAGAKFTLVSQEDGSGITAYTGETDGSGTTYFYKDESHTEKLMLQDGTYRITEVQAPEGYALRTDDITIKIYHDLQESRVVSVVVVTANGVVLTESVQEIGAVYKDNGLLIKHEINLEIGNSQKPQVLPKEYTLKVQKYGDASYTSPLAGAEFELRRAETQETESQGSESSESGAVVTGTSLPETKYTDDNGSIKFDTRLKATDRCNLTETVSPDGYYAMDDLHIQIDDNEFVYVEGVRLEDGSTVSSADADVSYTGKGSWTATLNGLAITIQMYDEPMPPPIIYWDISIIKYGTAVRDGNELAGAKFALYQMEGTTETFIAEAVSQDGTGVGGKGTVLFIDQENNPTRLEAGKTYCLSEISAPSGYQKMEDLMLTVAEDGTSIAIMRQEQLCMGDWIVQDADSKSLTLKITDEALYELPETGRGGIYKNSMLGVLIMCISLTGVLYLRKYTRIKS